MKKRVRAPSKPAFSKKAKTKGGYSLVKAVKPSIDGRNYNRKALTYCELGTTLDGGAGTAGTYVFSANGLYDPNITGVGHQPTGFDQLMAIYGSYTVTKATIKVGFWNTQVIPMLVGLSIQTFPGVSTDARVYIENQDCVWTMLEPLAGADGANAAGGPSIKFLTLECDMRKQARTDIFNDVTWSGFGTSNPGAQKYFHIFAESADGSTNPGAIGFVTSIDYEVYFREQQINALS